MRGIVLFLAWAGVIGSLLDGAITTVALWVILTTGDAKVGLSVDEHILQHLSFLYWIKDLAYFLLSDKFVDWLFGLPALVYFPFRILVNGFLGVCMFSLAKRMK